MTARAEPDGGARIEVVDTGVGIPAAEMPLIFDRFYRGTELNEAREHGIRARPVHRQVHRRPAPRHDRGREPRGPRRRGSWSPCPRTRARSPRSSLPPPIASRPRGLLPSRHDAADRPGRERGRFFTISRPGLEPRSGTLGQWTPARRSPSPPSNQREAHPPMNDDQTPDAPQGAGPDQLDDTQPVDVPRYAPTPDPRPDARWAWASPAARRQPARRRPIAGTSPPPPRVRHRTARPRRGASR